MCGLIPIWGAPGEAVLAAGPACIHLASPYLLEGVCEAIDASAGFCWVVTGHKLLGSLLFQRLSVGCGIQMMGYCWLQCSCFLCSSFRDPNRIEI